MNSEELLYKLDIAKDEYDKLLELIRKEKIKNAELKRLLKSSLTFRTFDIIQIIADLLTIKENNSFGPIIYNKGVEFNGFRKVAISISKDFADKKAERKYAKYLKSVDPSENYIDIYYNAMCKCGPNLEKLYYITFDKLLDKYDLFDDYALDSTILCHTDFKNYEYVNEFIEYLFDLQVQNDGRQLTYEKMQKALNDFLELEKDKPKQKIKEKEKES